MKKSTPGWAVVPLLGTLLALVPGPALGDVIRSHSAKPKPNRRPAIRTPAPRRAAYVPSKLVFIQPGS